MIIKSSVLANRLIEEGAIKFGAFKLKLHEKNPDAPLSPFYIDLRNAVRCPSFRPLITRAFLEKIQEDGLVFQRVADIPLSISPVVTEISNALNIGQLTLRTEKKEHGLKAMVLGEYKPGETVLICDDLITGADSKLEAIECTQSTGLAVKDILVLIDRDQGGSQKLAEAGYKLHAIFNWRALCQYYFEKGYIDKAKYDEIFKYLGAPS